VSDTSFVLCSIYRLRRFIMPPLLSNAAVRPPVCPSACLSHAPNSKACIYGCDYSGTYPMLEVEPTGQRGHTITRSDRDGGCSVPPRPQDGTGSLIVLFTIVSSCVTDCNF